MQPAPHPFTLRQLQYAVAVADELSFRRAADLCGVSQPSLSAQLSELEGMLRVRLFERDRRRVLLTPAGQALLPRARQLLLAADDLAPAARALEDPLAGTLRIGVIPTISPYLLPGVVPALRQKHPRLTVAWVEDKTSSLVAQLGAGTLDAALLALEAELGDLAHEVIASDPFVLATPANDPLGTSRTPATLEELHGKRILLLDEGHCLRDQALSFCHQADVREMTFRATSLSTLAQMVAGGAGITLLPELAVASETRRSAIRIRKLAEPAPARTIALVWRKASPFGDALRRLAATLREARAPKRRRKSAAR